jgi:hypothetical protein
MDNARLLADCFWFAAMPLFRTGKLDIFFRSPWIRFSRASAALREVRMLVKLVNQLRAGELFWVQKKKITIKSSLYTNLT